MRATFFLTLVLAASAGGAAAARPNVLLVLVDDYGARDLGCYGSRLYETPNMDALAAGGARFTDAYVAYPRCVPSRFAILTGKLPARYQTNRDSVHVEPGRDTTFGAAFREAGYRTFYAGKWHLGGEESLPGRVGFDETFAAGEAGATRSHFAPYGVVRGRGKGEKEPVPDVADAPEGEYLADRLTGETMEFVRRASKDGRPWLAVLAHYAVHTPIEGPAGLRKKYEGKLAADPPEGPELEPEGPGENLLVQNNAEYAAMVEAVDRGVGRLMKLLERKGLVDDTVVILTSDHGGLSARGGKRTMATSNRPLRAGKGHLYEGGLRVPLIVRWPGEVGAGRVVESPVIATDLFPTMLALAGLPLRPGEHVDGVSYAGLLTGGEDAEPRDLFWHNPAPRPSSTGDRFSSAVRSGGLKLVEYLAEGAVELYDLTADLGESENLVLERPEDRDRLLAKLRAWRAEVGASDRPREKKRR